MSLFSKKKTAQQKPDKISNKTHYFAPVYILTRYRVEGQ